MGSEYYVFVGAFISGFCALLLAFTDDKFKKALALFIFLGAMGSAFGALQGAKAEALFNKKMLNSVTGGDSYAYLDMVLVSGAQQPKMVLNNTGDYPIYDLSVQLVDLDEFEARKGQHTFESLTKNRQIFKIGNMSPNTTHILGDWPLSLEKLYYRYNIFTLSRNGTVTQNFHVRRIDGKWVRATRVFRDVNEPLKVAIDDEFPKDENNDVDW